VDAPDARTVRLRFAEARGARERALASVPILPAHRFAGVAPADLLAHATSRAPVGTGPYAFDAWEPGREIRLARSPRWRRGPPVSVARVVYRIVPDRTQALAQLRAGALDLVAQVPVAEADALAAEGFTLLAYEAPSFLAVTWNCRRPPLDRPEARRAMTHLLDRDTIDREVFRGRARALATPWGVGARPHPFDPARAAAARGATIRLLYPATSRAVERLATIWQEDARAAGVTLVLEPAPFDEVHRRAAAGDFDGVVLSWTAGPAQDFFTQLHSSQIGAGTNWGGFSDPETDRLLEALRRVPDAATRAALGARFHELQPLTIVSGELRTAAVSRRLVDVRMGDIGAPVRLMSIVE
jgi:peptide/nickel transport system substrate-binding protein